MTQVETDPLLLERMRAEWDERARENARFFIATSNEAWSDDEFFESGRQNLRDEILTDLGNICQGKDPKQMKVIEIGCGEGRITRALAEFFGEIYAVDVSGEMITRAKTALADVPNAHVFQNNGFDLQVLGDVQADFAFSYIVFQHIPSHEVIYSYVREVQRLLRPGGLFKFQVQGSLEDLPKPAEPVVVAAAGAAVEAEPTVAEAAVVEPVSLKTELADGRPAETTPAEISREQIVRTDELATDTWKGVYFTDAEAVRMAEECGFEPRYRHGAGTQYFWLWFFKK
jgi:SAM-dependent methyltransferase